MGPLEGNRTLPHRPSSLILPRSQLGFFARSTEPRNTLLLFSYFILLESNGFIAQGLLASIAVGLKGG